jgi:hypothetical protein
VTHLYPRFGPHLGRPRHTDASACPAPNTDDSTCHCDILFLFFLFYFLFLLTFLEQELSSRSWRTKSPAASCRRRPPTLTAAAGHDALAARPPRSSGPREGDVRPPPPGHQGEGRRRGERMAPVAGEERGNRRVHQAATALSHARIRPPPPSRIKPHRPLALGHRRAIASTRPCPAPSDGVISRWGGAIAAGLPHPIELESRDPVVELFPLSASRGEESV